MSNTSGPDSERDDRHLRLARRLGFEKQAAREKFQRSRVLIAIGSVTGGAVTACLMAEASLNLIARFCPRIDVYAPNSTDLAQELVTLGRAIDDSAAAEFRIAERFTINDYQAVLTIGSLPIMAPHMTAINASGWLAAVSSEGPCPILPDGPAGIGALAASAMGVSQIFIRLLEPRPGVAQLSGPIVFSTLDYSVIQTRTISFADSGPAIPQYVLAPTLLGGAGAVGQAVAYTLRAFPPSAGHLWIVDNKLISNTNGNRCVFATAAHLTSTVPPAKSVLVQTELMGVGGLHTFADPDLLEAVLDQPRENWPIPFPEIVIGAVDNYKGRQTLQYLWPNILVEGSTGDAEIQVLRWEYGKDRGCTLCYHEDPESQVTENYAEKMANLSGLNIQRVLESQHDAETMVTNADVAGAPIDLQPFLAQYLGQPICSTLSAVEKKSLLTDPPQEPSVSFASFLAGVLTAAEIIKYAAGIGHALDSQFQFNMMFPVTRAEKVALTSLSSCYCQKRHRTIDQYRVRTGRSGQQARQ